MIFNVRPILFCAALAVALFPAPRFAVAQEDHAHMHDTADAAVAKLSLDGDRKWTTDARLRAGMAAIGQAFDADHRAIHAGAESDAQYEALAARIDAEVKGIVANCHLPPAADANLHYVIADLLRGTSMMSGKVPDRTRHDGAALVHGALLAYGKYFDDPAAAADSHMPR